MERGKSKKRLLIVVSQIDKAISHEWIAEELRNKNYEVHFVLLNAGKSELENYLKLNQFPCTRIVFKSKLDIPRAIFRLVVILKKYKIEVVHAHLFEGGLIGMLAAKLAGIAKRIYTRHHSTFHHSYFPKAVKYDRLTNALSTDIIATSEVVKNVLISEHVPSRKIHLIHHGFRLEEFDNVPSDRIVMLKAKYSISGNPIIGVIARWIELKGIQFIIPAFKKLLIRHPNALLVLANCKGSYEDKIRVLLNEIPTGNYRIIDFEDDFFALYRAMEVLVHIPINSHAEAFGQVYVEGLAAGVSSVFTMSGIANEFLRDGENAIVVPYEDSNSVFNAINVLLDDQLLSQRLSAQGRLDVKKKFNLDYMIDKLDSLYMR